MATRFILLLLLCLGLLSPISAQLKATNTPPGINFLEPSYEVSFVWKSSRQGTSRDAHAALLIPVTLAHSAQIVYMQLDTGSPVSILYREQVHQLGLSDTAKTILDLELRVGNQKLVLKKPLVISKTAPSSQQTTDPLIIGTLGTDLLDNKITMIDYPRQRLTIQNDLPEAWQQWVSWSPLLYERGSLLLPAQIQGQAKLLYWDTGSSGFALLTDPTSWSSLAAKDSVSRSYPVQSWKQPLTAHTIATHASIQLASQKLPIGYVSYMEGATDSQINRMMALGISGLTGNKLFLGSVLLIDTRNKRYGFVPQ